ncbi:MAG: protein kinase [Phycisphaerales bacterium]|nr:protein kinase [Phycisphaerales bacterium]
MTPEQFERLQGIFERVRSCPRADQAAQLDVECAGDATLRRVVERLLDDDERPHAVLDQPPVAAAPLGAGIDGVRPDEIGGYRIIDVVGVGGMGVVYRAEQERPRRPVALKVIRPGALTPELRRRFDREADVLGRLQHPGIASIFEAGRAETAYGEQPFFAMEFVEGRPVTEAIRDHDLDLATQLELFARICDAVQHAHEQGIVHRDLKPGNILVDAAGAPKVLDFGVARLVAGETVAATAHTAPGQLVGTLPYMSPEQVAGDPSLVDTRTDVYALGVLLCELLTGRLPHDVQEKSLPEAARIIRDEEPTRLGVLDRRYRGDLETIVATAVERDPSRRYPSARALASDVRHYCRDEPIVARPPTTLYQLGKFARRNRILVGGVAGVIIALAIGTIVSTTAFVGVSRRAEALRRSHYVKDIALAESSYRNNEYERMHEALARCPEDLRHWEWQRLTYLSDRSDLVIPAHRNAVRCLAIAPDGTWVASGGNHATGVPVADRDTTIRVWETRTGTLRLELRDHRIGVGVLAVSPSGTRLASASAKRLRDEPADAGIRLWDTTNGRLLQRIDPAVTRVAALAFDGETHLVSGGGDGRVRRHDLTTGETRVIGRHQWDVTDLAVGPDGTVASSGWEGEIHWWDRDDAIRVWPGHRPAHCRSLAARPDWSVLASCSRAEIELWNAASGVSVGRLIGHTDMIERVRFTPDGRSLVSASHDGTIRVWDPIAGVDRRVLRGHRGRVIDVAVGPDGRTVISGGVDGTVRRWSLESPGDVMTILESATELNTVRWSPDGTRVAFGGDDGIARVHDAIRGRELRRLAIPGASLYSMSWHPGGDELAIGTYDGRLIIWPVDGDRTPDTRQAHDGPVWTVAFDPAGRRLLTGGGPGTLAVWNVAERVPIHSIAGHEAPVRQAVWDAAGVMIVTVSEDGTIAGWNAGDGTPRFRFGDRTRPYTAVAFDRTQTRLFVGDTTGGLRVWNITRGNVEHDLVVHESDCYGVDVSPDGRRLITSGDDHRIKVLDAETGEDLLRWTGHAGTVFQARFSPDGHAIASVGADGTARIWRTVDPVP